MKLEASRISAFESRRDILEEPIFRDPKIKKMNGFVIRYTFDARNGIQYIRDIMIHDRFPLQAKLGTLTDDQKPQQAICNLIATLKDEWLETEIQRSLYRNERRATSVNKQTIWIY